MIDNYRRRYEEVTGVYVKKLRWVLFALYCLFIVWFTILSREPSSNHEFEFTLFWAYRRFYTGGKHGRRLVIQNLQNVAFFIPFGVLMPVKKWWAVCIAALTLSLSVEIAQYVGGYGLAELDDVICNVLGALLGYCIVLGLKRVVSKEN